MKNRERGTAMILALMVMGMAASLGAILLERARGLEASTSHDRTELTSLYAAEGGLAHARHTLARDEGFSGERIRVGDREVEIVVEEADDGWTVVSSTTGVRIDATLSRNAFGLPVVADWRMNRP